MTPANIAVFASGNGSNYEALMAYFSGAGREAGRVVLLVCDRPGAFVLERAKKWGTPVFVTSPKLFASKADYEQAVLKELQAYDVEFIVLAGYMRLICPALLHPYMGRVVNIHPSLLPAFPGLDAIGQALDYGVRVTGITIHFVDEGMDTGPIIAQFPVPVAVNETKESLTRKIQEAEHEWYPKVVQKCVQRKIRFEGGKVQWDQASVL